MEAAKWHLEPISEADFLSCSSGFARTDNLRFTTPYLSLLWCGETVPRRFETCRSTGELASRTTGARRGVREAVGRGSHAPTRVTSVARALKAGKVLDMSAAGLP